MLAPQFLFRSVIIITAVAHNINIEHIILENVMAFLFVGALEYMFFTKIALHYVPTMPSLMEQNLSMV